MSSDSNTITFLFTVVVAFVVIRWFITSETADGGPGPNAAPAGEGEAAEAQPRRNLQPVQFDRRPVTPAMVEIVQQMAPHLSEEQIRYDLQRTGNIEETVERVLAEGTLPYPPEVNLRPVRAPASSSSSTPEPAAPQAASSSSSSASTPVPRASKSSLIDKYNLKDRLMTEDADEETPKPKMKWSQNKDERQAQLKKQREDMILKARRKLELKESKLK